MRAGGQRRGVRRGQPRDRAGLLVQSLPGKRRDGVPSSEWFTAPRACFCLKSVSLVRALTRVPRSRAYAYPDRVFSTAPARSAFCARRRRYRRPLPVLGSVQVSALSFDNTISVWSKATGGDAGTTLAVDVSFQYEIDYKKIGELYRLVGMDWEPIIQSYAIDAIRNTAPEFSADQFLMRRAEIENVFARNVSKAIAPLHCTIHSLQLRRIDFDDDYQDMKLTTAIQTELNEAEKYVQQSQIIRLMTDVESEVVLNQAKVSRYRRERGFEHTWRESAPSVLRTVHNSPCRILYHGGSTTTCSTATTAGHAPVGGRTDLPLAQPLPLSVRARRRSRRRRTSSPPPPAQLHSERKRASRRRRRPT